jgi:phosphoribosyl 1,2-cyclic phosphate phosphodiesterase
VIRAGQLRDTAIPDVRAKRTISAGSSSRIDSGMMDKLELLFLGTGTSTGIPMIGCRCEVCTSGDPKDKRNRVSVVVSYRQTRVLIDAPPELRLACIAYGVDTLDAVVFTHGHADHIMGLDDLRRFNTIRRGPLDVWADAPTHGVLTQCFLYAFREPDSASRLFRPHLLRRLVEGPFEIAGVAWTPIPLLHGDVPVLGFRVGNMAYCTDVSQMPEESFAKLQGLDVLVLDGLQWQKHTTHFSLEEAIAVAARIGAKQTLFTHIAHGLGHAATSSRLPSGMALAYDGLCVTAGLQARSREVI